MCEGLHGAVPRLARAGRHPDRRPRPPVHLQPHPVHDLHGQPTLRRTPCQRWPKINLKNCAYKESVP